MEHIDILVVDDDQTMREAISVVLEGNGYRVLSAWSGQDGVDLAMREQPRLILSDVMMPGVSGWTLVERLRGLKEFALTPIILLTRLNSPEDRLKALQVGADDVLHKPVHFRELLLRVAAALKRQEQWMDAAGQTKVGVDASLMGSTQQIGLPSVMTILAHEGRSGRLIIEGPREEKAVLAIRDGRVLRATVEGGEQLPDAEAVLNLLRWKSGRFLFHDQPVGGNDRICQSITGLLLEAARREDEGTELLIAPPRLRQIGYRSAG